MGDTWRGNQLLETIEAPLAVDAQSARRMASDDLRRWQAGEPADAHAALRRYPQLARFTSLVVELACEEFKQRTAAGEKLDAFAFSRQFPDCPQPILRELIARGSEILENPRYQLPNLPDFPQLGSEYLGFFLCDLLGIGAFAEVYLATEPNLANRRVALKVSVRGRQEAQLLGKLRHPNVVPVYRVDQDPKTRLTAICMPYLGRATLADVLAKVFFQKSAPLHARTILEVAQRDEPLAVGDEVDPWLCRGTYTDGILRLGEQLAAGLHCTHQMGIFHLDLKPSNVLLTPAGRPMLLDFNLSRERDLPIERMGGTLPYMSPEQLRALLLGQFNATVDHRSDIYSLGVLLYELLCGSLPYGDLAWKSLPETVGRQLYELQQSGPPSLHVRHPQIDRRIAHLIERCLEFDPQRRFQSAEEVGQALRHQLGRVSQTRRWLNRHRPLVYAGVLSAATLSGLATGYALSREPPWVRSYRAGQTAYDAGRYEQAIDHLTSSLQANPHDFNALVLCGKAQQKAGDFSRAATNYHLALKQTEDPQLWARRGYCLCMCRSYQSAILCYDRAIAGGFANATLWRNLGACHDAISRHDQARTAFTRALEVDNQSGLAYFGRANAEFKHAYASKSQASDQCLDDIKNALERLPPSAELLGTAAMLYASSNDRPELARESLSLLENAVALGFNPNPLAARFRSIAQNPAFHALCETSKDKQTPPTPWFQDPVAD